MKKLAQLKELFNKDVTDTLKKHKIPLVGGLVVFLLACVGIFITYAYYQVTDVTPIIGGSTGKIADLDVRVMAEERDTNGNGLGSYALYPYIPEAGYAYNEGKSYCTNGSTINYNPATYEADITAYGHDVCYLYFDSTANLDLTLNVYAQNIDSDGNGIEGEYTKLETTALPSIGYVLNTEKSSCENGSSLSYSDEENMFTVDATGKDVCTAYMDAIDVDIQLKLYIQAKAGSSTYYEADTIPSNVYYELGSESACTGTSTLSIQNQKVVIAATSRTSCVAYLNVADGPIIQSMQLSANTVTLNDSNAGTNPTTYYYSADAGANYVSSSDNTYTFENVDPNGTEFKAYAVDASGNTSSILTTTTEDNYVFNGIYDYSSGVQTVPIEVSGYYYLQVWGAQGGSYNEEIAPGGNGGYSKGYIYLNAGDTLYINTGGKGGYGTSNSSTATSGGGVNGGGSAGYRGGAGGGATDIRINQNDLYSRVIVAGGGGGSFYQSSSIYALGGAGGGATGVAGEHYNSSYAYYSGKGGTQTAGGSGGTAEEKAYYGNAGVFGIGGNTGTRYQSTSIYSNGAGGGGWYGGGAAGHYNGETNNRYAGGGGGSGYVYTESTASSYPNGCLLNDSYYLTNASTHAGNTAFESTTGGTETGHAGNGYAKITYIGQTLS
ncbi:MAG TPA: hypothetical protein IAB40_01995 [Candidatus Onthocola stercoravium]|nr:hypothetical protein [Candidatus Onthocola stercoravium]